MRELSDKRFPALYPVEICFSKKQRVYPSCVSNFLQTSISETSTSPIYYHFKHVLWGGKPFVALYYVMFFDTNPGYCFNLGAHPADVERCVILFDFDSLEPKFVFFGAHGNGQGSWLPFAECEKNTFGALRIFVSPTSNAFYPKAKVYWRAFGLLNDVTSDDGKKWQPSLANFQLSDQQSWSHTHYQVAKGINNPMNVPDPEAYSITTWERFAIGLPFINERLKKRHKISLLSDGKPS